MANFCTLLLFSFGLFETERDKAEQASGPLCIGRTGLRPHHRCHLTPAYGRHHLSPAFA